MEERTKLLKQKHSEFFEQVNKQCVKEGDYFGNARRIEDYLEELKKRNVNDFDEKEELLTNMIKDNELSDAYEAFLEEQDAPRWFLEKTYPIFYNYFKKRYELFIETWEKAVTLDKISKKFKDELFVDLCKKINYEIKGEYGIEDALKDIEKNGLPKKEQKKLNLNLGAIEYLVDTVLELPGLILQSINNSKNKWNYTQKEFIEKQKERQLFAGNPLTKRKGNTISKYETIAKLIRVFEEEFSYVSGIQKKACEMLGCNPNSFSRWMNRSEDNRNQVMKWRNDLPEPVRMMLKEKIEESFKKK